MVLFALFTMALLGFTLRRPYAHRWFRFIAFECVLALVFLQSDRWFTDPLRAIQLISWFTLMGSLALAIHGFYLLQVRGAPEGDIEKTTILITSGAYQFIRHPLYASLLLFGIGALLKHVTVVASMILVGLVLAVYATARVEERANLERFGEAYRNYLRRTKMFIPYIW